MKKPLSIRFLSPSHQRGWIMLEVILCLALFAVVLHLAQRQNQVQWHAIQKMEAQRNRQENQQKQAAMVALTGSSSWLSDQEKKAYPDCQTCSGSQLEGWFYGSLHRVSNATLGGEK